MTTILKSENLSKKYKNELALFNVSINVQSGDIYGLIGRNGAGKTTLMKIINRQIHASSGKIWIHGQDISKKDNYDIRIGTLIEAPGLYNDLTAHQNLELKCIACGIRRSNYVSEILSLVGFKSSQINKKKVRNFSLGMKQRLGIALALVGDPDILLLDEPTNGMDPQGMNEFRELIIKLNRERHLTIIISSHILGELSKYTSRIGVIHRGKLIKEMSNDELNQINQDYIRIIGKDHAKIISHLQEKLSIKYLKQVSDVELRVYEHLDNPAIISHELIQSGILFEQISIERSSLEEFFIDVTGGQANV
ncbi:ATP-binding cassette domain-containing protein [Facklamia sp. 7083-14-GEN3]|uniref:ATP-binding cassette domain-containing protein n=1 Tax=Facklamia sp. 7083-14-GEN3 TaxID=2973478 RepID=UPI00215BEDC1|nr:ATP-binding cassette domain-containing protein [Facklamia sp. 7083-14-GEN3]MCR8969413.1 ATP-binding cassette domain-containing protein [Facklamia sp. 7083-14-GEN3]